MDPIRRIASLGSQLSSSFANRAPHRDAAPFLYPICSPLFYAYLHLHLGWCSIFPSETAETLAAARVSGVASFSATLVVFCCRKRYMDSYLPCCLMACTVAPIASDRVSRLHSFQNLTVALFGFCFGSSMRIRLGNSEASPTAMASPISKMAISLQISDTIGQQFFNHRLIACIRQPRCSKTIALAQYCPLYLNRYNNWNTKCLIISDRQW